MSEREATELDEREALLTQNQFPLGSIPKGWKVVKLNKTLSKVIDNRGKTPPFAENGAHELIEIASLRNVEKNPNYSAVTKYVSADVFESWFRDHIKDDDILVSTVGSVGLSALIEEKRGAIAQNLIALRTNELCDARFLFNWTRSSDCHRQIRRVVMDAVQPSLKLPHFLNCFVHLPPLPEQRKIASILTTVDYLIEYTEALIEKYKSIKQGMMHDLFTRGVDSTGQLRPPYEDAPELYKESELGWIPKEWEVDSVHNVSLQVTDGDHHTPRRSTEGVLLLSARNVRDGYLALKNVDYVDETEYSRMIKRCHPESGDILISCSGTIGKICAVPSNFRCCLVRSAALVKLDRQVIDTRFGEWSFRTSIVQRQIAATQLQAAQPNLFQGGIRSLLLIIPSISEQQFIALRLDALEHGIQAEQKQGVALRTIKSGLMQDLLTGKVRVNVDETEEVTANV
jgi:type I restriction enzyme S subunit